MNEYFTELSRVLKHNGIQTAPPQNSRLPVLIAGETSAQIEPNGSVWFAKDKYGTPMADEIYHKATEISARVLEYFTAVKRAPLLQADGLDEKYGVMAEFNGIVLAGREMEQGYGMKFVTWQRDYDGSGVTLGHYFMDHYEQAKEDFALRSGLMDKHRVFDNKQLIEIYRCIQDTLDGVYELTDAQTELLEQTAEQIESALPDIKKRIAYEMDTQFNM